MKFSYEIIKQLVPEAESMSKVMDTITMHTMPAEDPEGNTFDGELPSNRYADLASHMGVAREYAAVSGKKLQEPEIKKIFPFKEKGNVKISIKSSSDCPRYTGCLYELGKKGQTPAWMKKALKDCGLRPLSPVVDILNYVMLETGQPMHAFDADKLSGGITVRKAKDGEKITTIDDQRFKLSKKDLVIADDVKAQALAGIKGGKASEVTAKTKKILVEAANFDQVLVYKTTKALKLKTDAGDRFSHGMSPESVELGMERARVLLEEIVGAELIDAKDVYPKKQNKKVIGFSTERFNSLTGLELKPNQALKYLQSLGFKKATKKSASKKDDFMVEVPSLRLDVQIPEDLIEEVVRMYGIDSLEPQAPSISIQVAKEQDITIFKDRVRNTLNGIGFSEVYSTSFVGKGDNNTYEVEKPLAEDKPYLRQRVSDNLKDHVKENLKYFDRVRIFEMGNVFDRKKGEATHLGIADGGDEETVFLELRGAVEQLLTGLGFIDFTLIAKGDKLMVEVNREIVGEITHAGKGKGVAELNATRLMELEEGEFEYQPISKYPAVMRDLSLALKDDTKVGDILYEIEQADAKHAIDVDLIDYYDPRHITFRIIFQSDSRTLKDSEVNEEFEKISSHLKKKFRFEIR